MALSTILTPGTRIGGKYDVVEVVGFGGMGVVYKVREQVGAVSRIRALKTVLPQYAADPAVVKRFREEAEKMCMLEHENIVPVLSYSEEGEFPYLIMPFIEGRTLKDHLAAHVAEHGRPLPLAEVMEIGLAVVDGLEVAHRFLHPETKRPQPMIHRDIKPGNIMVRVEDRGGERRLRILIMDFGIAKVVSEEDTGHSLTDVIGTVKYASPEQVKRGKDIDPRADIYSLGMVLYELYYGRHMFAGMSEHSVLLRMMQREVEEQPPEFPEGTPEAFRDLVTRSVAIDRARRYSSVAEMRVAMRRILDEDSDRAQAEASRAREAAIRRREEAVGQRAADLAPEPFGEAESLFARAEEARASRGHAQALSLFRAAETAFDQAARAAARARQGEHVAAALDELERRQAAAASTSADRLAEAEFAVAGRATDEARRALASGEVTASARFLAEAERAWRDFESAAARERDRQRLAAAVAALDADLAAEAATWGGLPPAFRPKAAEEALARARAAGKAAATAVGGGDLDAAETRIAEARRALGDVTSARERATADLERRSSDLAAELARRLEEVESSGRHEMAPDLHAEVREAAAASAHASDAGRLPEAYAGYERALSLLAHLEQTIETRLADEKAAERRAREARAGAERAAAEGPAHSPDEAVRDLGRRAGDAWDAAERAREAGDWTSAVSGYLRAGEAWREAARVEHDRLAARREELRRQAVAGTQALGALGADALADEESRRLLRALATAEERAAAGDLTGSNDDLERLLPDLGSHLDVVRARLERRRAEAEADARRGEAETALARVRALGERAAADEAFHEASGLLSVAEARRAGGDLRGAADAFTAAARALETLATRVDDSLRAERLAALRVHLDALSASLAAAPSDRKHRRSRKAALAALRRAESALSAGDEAAAQVALDESEPILRDLLSQPTVVLQPSVERSLPVGWYAAGAGAAVAVLALGYLLFGREPIRVANVPTPAPRPRTEATAPPPTGVIEPTIPPRPADTPLPEPTIAATVAPTTIPATAVPPAEPTGIPLALASASPRERTLRLAAGSEQRFEAEVRGSKATELVWELDRIAVARGDSFTLRKRDTRRPGEHRLDLVARRDESRTVLSTWQVEIRPPALSFAKLEPRAEAIESAPGRPLAFRAAVGGETADQLSFTWQVNGRRADQARGPTYELAAADPGLYRVTVSAVAPWGDRIDHTWNVTIKPPPPPPAPTTAPPKIDAPDPRTEVLAWVDAYCRAFERKDTAALVRLGHVASGAEEDKLRGALAAMEDLKLSCTNPSIELDGDQAVVSFDRMDRWNDPNGTRLERRLPRITKQLRRDSGRWTAIR